MKLLILLSRVPYPTEKGDKLRAFHQIRCLSEHHEIILCALSEGPVHPDAESILLKYCKQVYFLPIHRPGRIWNVLKAFVNGNPIQTGYFYRNSVKRKILKIIKQNKPDHIYCQLLRMAEYVRQQKIPKTLDYQDVFSMGMRRLLDTSPWGMKPMLTLEYKRLLKYENAVFDDFDHKTIISAPDRDLIPHPGKQQIVIVPNGVDHQYFRPLVRTKVYDLLFTGNMGYPPNVNAAEFLAGKIFPLVRNRMPSARLLIAGANPHSRILSFQSDTIEVSGWVPDIRESYASSRVFIAPMRIGTGLQNKLLEAMSMKLPCITSALANNALGATANKEILVGNTNEEYADHIITLLNNPDLADSIAENGCSFVNSAYNWQKSTDLLEKLFNLHTNLNK